VHGRLHVAGVAAEGDPAAPAPGIQPLSMLCHPQ
jgi:hypothetical protein